MDSLWRYAFLLGTYIALSVIVVLMRSGPEGSIPLLQGFNFSKEHEIATVATPARLRVPRLGVDVPIVPVGLTTDGNMGIPESPWEAGWFDLGTAPGNPGNAVIAGHLDTVLGTPAVFFRLHELQSGDDIFIDAIDGTTVRFRVNRSSPYDAANAPLEEIFGATDERRLQLITCNGSWLVKKGTYEKRLVVFSAAIDGESSSIARTSDSFPLSL